MKIKNEKIMQSDDANKHILERILSITPNIFKSKSRYVMPASTDMVSNKLPMSPRSMTYLRFLLSIPRI